MINEQDAWLETLGVTGFKSSDDESSEADEAGATTDNGFDPVSGPDTDASEAEQPAQADVTVGGGPSSSKLLMDAPIGVLELISSSQADSTGRVFSVVVASSTKDALLFAAVVSGTSVGTVKIAQASGVITLQNVQITAINTLGSNLAMTLESIPPKKKRGPASSTLIMDAPIGVLQLISSSPVGSAGRGFNVVVASSAKDALLFAANVSGTSVGSVKISQPGGVITLQDVQITGISISGTGSDTAMTLDSSSPAEFSSE